MNETPTLLRVEEAARALSLGRSKVYELIQSGEIESISIGRARRIPAKAIEEFVSRKMVEGGDGD